MKLLDIVSKDAVVARVGSDTRDSVIEELVGALIAAGKAEESMRSELVANVLDRESMPLAARMPGSVQPQEPA